MILFFTYDILSLSLSLSLSLMRINPVHAMYVYTVDEPVRHELYWGAQLVLQNAFEMAFQQLPVPSQEPTVVRTFGLLGLLGLLKGLLKGLLGFTSPFQCIHMCTPFDNNVCFLKNSSWSIRVTRAIRATKMVTRATKVIKSASLS